MALNEIDGVIVSAEKYDEADLLRRIGRMMKGLSCPRASQTAAGRRQKKRGRFHEPASVLPEKLTYARLSSASRAPR